MADRLIRDSGPVHGEDVAAGRRSLLKGLAVMAPALALLPAGRLLAANPPVTDAGAILPPASSAPFLPADLQPQVVAVSDDLVVGSLLILTAKFYLYHVIAPGQAVRYGVAVGQEGLAFRGSAVIARKVEWPGWRPTPEMVERNPAAYSKYADGMPGGPTNPLGARALYFYQNGRDTAIRIHGTTQPRSIGKSASNGCFRMVNDHVIHLYSKVPLGSPVTVW